jgi:hypothetical protein
MNKRYLIAGVLGGVAMFVWMSIAHMALPLGRTGIQEIPNEQAVLSSMQSTLGNSSGFYMFPGMGSETDMGRYEQKLATNPSGMVIYHPPGAKAMEPSQLIIEFLTEMLEALLAVFLLSRTRLDSFASRAGFIAVVGVVASLATNVPYWNWYGFPSSYTAAYMLTEIIGYVVIGLVAGAILKPSPVRSPAMAV